MSKLSAIAVRNAKPKEKPYKRTDGKGLYLHIATNGKKNGDIDLDWPEKSQLLSLENTLQ